MVDIHTHLYFPQYDADREEVIRRAFASGLTLMISVGTSPEDNVKAIEISQLDERIYASVGLHPHWFNEPSFVPLSGTTAGKQKTVNNKQKTENKELVFRKEIDELRTLVLENKDKVVAIGEAGLDYFSRTPEPISEEQKERQKEGLFMQMELAQELGLPMILHCRDAYEDLYEILKVVCHSERREESRKNTVGASKFGIATSKTPRNDMAFILHCYMGDTDITKKFLALPNVYFSFTGNITYPIKKILEGTKDDLQETVKLIPLERLLTETDCPFLAPQAYRGQRNEPAFVKETVEWVAVLQRTDSQRVTQQVGKNADNIFWKRTRSC